METVTTSIRNTIEEYQGIFSIPIGSVSKITDSDWTNIENKLQTDAGWTEEGSKHVVSLVRNYGSFVLRNALSLAITLDIEDGKYGL